MKHTNRKLVTISMLVAILLVAIDVTIVSNAMPKIVQDLSGMSLISWVFAIYTLTTAVTTPIYGKLADLFGRKIIFSLGVILFVLGSMLSGASHTMTQLIWFRAFQGIGAGAVMPLTFTIIGDLYPGEQRAKMQGLFSSIWGIAGLLGPLVGGLFVDHISWRWIFYINVPVGAVSLILIWIGLHEHFERNRKPTIDYFGAITFTISMSALLYALLNGGQKYAWNSNVIIVLFVITAVFIGLFLWIESKSKEPMLPLSLFAIRVIGISNVANFFLSAVLISITVYMPMWFQDLLGYSATRSGLTIIPMSIGWPIGATIAGRVMYKMGTKATTIVGAIFITLASGALLSIVFKTPVWFLDAILVAIGLGMGLATTPFTVMVQSAVGWNLRGAATASSTFMRSLGQTVGVAIFGSVFNHSLSQYMLQKYPSYASHRGEVSQMLTSGASVKLPPAALSMVQNILVHSLHTVFIAVFICAVLGFLMTLLMPLHKHVMAQQAGKH